MTECAGHPRRHSDNSISCTICTTEGRYPELAQHDVEPIPCHPTCPCHLDRFDEDYCA